MWYFFSPLKTFGSHAVWFQIRDVASLSRDAGTIPGVRIKKLKSRGNARQNWINGRARIAARWGRLYNYSNDDGDDEDDGDDNYDGSTSEE